MLRFTVLRAAANRHGPLSFLTQRRDIHDRNKKAMELIAKGWSALKEVDRVIDYAELNDKRLIPLLRSAKENFELALEIDNMNTHARYWLGRMHFKYHVPGACKLVGAALLVEAANMGNADAQYELGCHLRVEAARRTTRTELEIISKIVTRKMIFNSDCVVLLQNDYVQEDQKAFHYIEKAVDQLHPGALYLLGAVYLSGDCVKKDVDSAIWCFHRASQKGHAGAAIAYGSLLLKGAQIPEVITRFYSSRSPSTGGAKKKGKFKNIELDPIKLATEQFLTAAESGCDLGLRWLKRLEAIEKYEARNV